MTEAGSVGPKSCPICSSAARPYSEKDGYPIATCSGCGHRFVSSEVDPAALEGIYQENYYRGDGYQDYLEAALAKSKGFEMFVDDVSRRTAGTGRWLDFGCAIGLLVKAAQDRGWEAVGYERSEWAVEYGRRELGLDLRLGTAAEGDPFEPESFDVVSFMDVVEHLAEPREVLGMAARWLKPGGVLVLNTVNSSSLGSRLAGRAWRFYTPPWHLQYFTRHSLRLLLKTVGLRPEVMSAAGVLLRAKDPDRASAWRRRVDRMLGYWRLRRVMAWLNVLDEVEIVARKR